MTAVPLDVHVAGPTAARRPTVEFVLAAALAGLLSVRLPLHTVVLGLVVFGIVHNALELRYVLGRFNTVLQGPFLRILLAGISLIAVRRLVWSGPVGELVEILAGYAILGIALFWAARERPAMARLGGLVLGGAAAVSVVHPALHFVVITHLHNLVPLVFLWEWAGRLPLEARRRFRAAQVGWVVVLPALVFLGAADALLPSLPGRFAGLDTVATVAAYTPPVLRDATLWGARFLTVFAFLQAMHYFVWCGFLPRHAPDVAAAFDRKVAVGRRYGSRVVVAAAVVAASALAVVFWHDYATGRSLYAAISTYHAYLEWPVILALVLGLRSEASAT